MYYPDFPIIKVCASVGMSFYSFILQAVSEQVIEEVIMRSWR
jgi:hypothetical protein